MYIGQKVKAKTLIGDPMHGDITTVFDVLWDRHGDMVEVIVKHNNGTTQGYWPEELEVAPCESS